jgi:hypothetical protein
MKIQISLFLSLLLILFVYSSEISFMPNYKFKPDKWHLFTPMSLFYIALITQLIWSVIEKIRLKKNYFDISMISISILLFSVLNTLKGDLQTIGYIGLIIINIILIVLHLIQNKRNHTQK